MDKRKITRWFLELLAILVVTRVYEHTLALLLSGAFTLTNPTESFYLGVIGFVLILLLSLSLIESIVTKRWKDFSIMRFLNKTVFVISRPKPESSTDLEVKDQTKDKLPMQPNVTKVIKCLNCGTKYYPTGLEYVIGSTIGTGGVTCRNCGKPASLIDIIEGD